VSVNAESARYKELKDDKFYIPIDWSKAERERYAAFAEKALTNYHETLNRLVESGMSRSRAKESARYYLPYGTQIKCDVMFNWRSLHHFLGLRMKPDAQLEIREIASNMLELVKTIPGDPFKHTVESFGY
jgi:thymidylate synthase (FAD)